jgi:hypothetical protein
VNDSCDLSPHSALRESVLDSHQTTRLNDALDDGVAVEWFDSPQVDDLAGNALLCQFFCGLEGVFDVAGVGDDGDVLALPHYLSLADRHHKIL